MRGLCIAMAEPFQGDRKGRPYMSDVENTRMNAEARRVTGC